MSATQSTYGAPSLPAAATPLLLKAAYDYCHKVTKNHYENFPVASLIIPKKIRPAIEAIYAFSRMADDFADEPEYQGHRLKKLEHWEAFLNDNHAPTHPVFIALHDACRKYLLPKSLFQDLLTAFKMDVQKKRYETFDEVLFYCRYSANPVGRLILHLFGHVRGPLIEMSDAVCTGLQLANFWQDVAVDLAKDRVYLPLEDLAKYGLTEAELFHRQCGENFRRLLCFEIERTKEFFKKGKDLGLLIPGKLGLELRLTWLGGVRILQKIQEAQYDVFQLRPTLGKRDFIGLFFTALSLKKYERFVA